MLSNCRICGARLVPGPDVARSASGKGFTCEIEGLPTLVCPSGCSGQYWADPDFGASVLELISPGSENVAWRRFPPFTTRNLCRQCRSELADNHQTSSFAFVAQPLGATAFAMTITAPSLTCPNCLRQYIPAQKSSWDPYYVDLTAVIAKAITKELIYK